jgi:hypothetical protein
MLGAVPGVSVSVSPDTDAENIVPADQAVILLAVSVATVGEPGTLVVPDTPRRLVVTSFFVSPPVSETADDAFVPAGV